MTDSLQQRTESITKKVLELATLYEMSRALGSTLDLDVLLDSVLDSALRIFNVESGYVVLRDRDTEQLELTAWRGTAGERPDERARAQLDVRVGRRARGVRSSSTRRPRARPAGRSTPSRARPPRCACRSSAARASSAPSRWAAATAAFRFTQRRRPAALDDRQPRHDRHRQHRAVLQRCRRRTSPRSARSPPRSTRRTRTRAATRTGSPRTRWPSPSSSTSRPSSAPRSRWRPTCTTSARSASARRSCSSPASSTTTRWRRCATIRSSARTSCKPGRVPVADRARRPAPPRALGRRRATRPGLRGRGDPAARAHPHASPTRYEAMTSDRPYRRGRTPRRRSRSCTRCAGTQFDPRIVEAFVDGARGRGARPRGRRRAGCPRTCSPTRRARSSSPSATACSRASGASADRGSSSNLETELNRCFVAEELPFAFSGGRLAATWDGSPERDGELGHMRDVLARARRRRWRGRRATSLVDHFYAEALASLSSRMRLLAERPGALPHDVADAAAPLARANRWYTSTHSRAGRRRSRAVTARGGLAMALDRAEVRRHARSATPSASATSRGA